MHNGRKMGVENLSLLLRGGFARPRPLCWLLICSVSVHHHCIDAENRRLTDQKPATPCNRWSRAPTSAEPVGGYLGAEFGGGQTGLDSLGRNSSRRVGSRVVEVPNMPTSLAVTNKLICASKAPSTVTSGGRLLTTHSSGGRGGRVDFAREALGSPTFDSGLRGSNKLWQGSHCFLTTLFCGSGPGSRKRLKFLLISAAGLSTRSWEEVRA